MGALLARAACGTLRRLMYLLFRLLVDGVRVSIQN